MKGARTAHRAARRRPAIACLLAAAWMGLWAWLVRRSARPLWIDHHVSAVLSVNQHLQDDGIVFLHVEGPATATAAAVVLAAIAVADGARRAAAAILIGVACEIASVQWLIKPLVNRHEIAPDPAFPSSHVGAVVAVQTAAVLLLCRLTPPSPPGARGSPAWRRRGLITIAVVDSVLVAAATIATGGHLFSDVVAVVPWAVALPWLAFAVLARPPTPSDH